MSTWSPLGAPQLIRPVHSKGRVFRDARVVASSAPSLLLSSVWLLCEGDRLRLTD